MSATMFKAIVWKELRANANCAVTVMLCMSVALVVGIPSVDDLLRNLGVDLNSIVKVLDLTTTFGGPLAGLLFGAAQTLAENRGDKWGFLAHRPASRTTLFWGKATAGILLYAFSTGVPVIAALVRVSSPGYLPVPFDWRIALPAIANLLCGVVFYFAAFLTGMRQARWYASRTLGFGVAICCLILQWAVAVEFWQSAAMCAGGLILVGTAAWSSFVAGGQYGAQPRIGLLATGASIGFGVVLAGWLVLSTSLKALPVPEDPRYYRSTTLVVTNEGVVARIDRVDDTRVASGDWNGEISYPDGRPMELSLNSRRGQFLGRGVLSETLWTGRRTPPSFRSTSRLFSELRRARSANPIGWYYAHRLGLLTAYDSESRKLIGWIGPDGFSPVDVKPRAFPGRLVAWASDGLVFEDAIYRMNLDDRRVEKAFQADPAETILGSAQNRASTVTEYGEMAQFEVIRTTRRVIVQLRDGTRILEAPPHARAREYPVLQVTRALWAPGDPTFLLYRNNSFEEGLLSEFDSAGRVVNSWTLPAAVPEWNDTLPRIAIASAMFPLMGLSSFDIAGWMRRFEIRFDLSFLPRSPGTAGWAAALLSSLVSAAAVFLHGRRYAFPPGRVITWMGIALLLGPLGYLTMLALIEWPARESCPACSRKRVVTREHCEHCGEPFAAPPQDGTEIFEPVPDVPA